MESHVEDRGSIRWDELPEAPWTRILSFLTLFELIIDRTVSRSFNGQLIPKTLALASTLNLSQFWACLGDPSFILEQLEPTLGCVARINAISLEYCHLLTDSALLSLLRLLPSETKSQIERLSLHYCFQLRDAAIIQLSKMFPNLKVLDLSRCILLTDAAVTAVAKNCRQLKRLYLAGLLSLTNDVLLDLGSMENLEYLDVQKTPILEMAVQEQRTQSPALTIVGPSVVKVPAPSYRSKPRADDVA
jgi:hypothetical protein